MFSTFRLFSSSGLFFWLLHNSHLQRPTWSKVKFSRFHEILLWYLYLLLISIFPKKNFVSEYFCKLGELHPQFPFILKGYIDRHSKASVVVAVLVSACVHLFRQKASQLVCQPLFVASAVCCNFFFFFFFVFNIGLISFCHLFLVLTIEKFVAHCSLPLS